MGRITMGKFLEDGESWEQQISDQDKGEDEHAEDYNNRIMSFERAWRKLNGDEA